jgi:hypothetical protein
MIAHPLRAAVWLLSFHCFNLQEQPMFIKCINVVRLPGEAIGARTVLSVLVGGWGRARVTTRFGRSSRFCILALSNEYAMARQNEVNCLISKARLTGGLIFGTGENHELFARLISILMGFRLY